MALLAVSAAVAFGQETEQRKRARVAFSLGMTLVNRDKDFVGAREAFRQALQLDPGYSAPAYNLGVLAEGEEDWKTAIHWFNEFLRLDGGSTNALSARLRLDRAQKALEQDKTADGKKARRYGDAIARAYSLLEAHRPLEALEEASFAVRIDGSKHEAFAVGGLALYRQQIFKGAATFLREALARCPEEQKGAFSRAIEDCVRQDEAQGHATAGGDALRAGEYRKAADHLARAWRMVPLRSDIGLAAATALALADRHGECAKVLRALAVSSDKEIAAKASEHLKRVEPLVRPVTLGVEVLASDGMCLIAQLASNGPARRAGLRAGDAIVRFGTSDIRQPADLQEALNSFDSGDLVSAEVMRGTERLTVQLKLVRRAGRAAFLGVGIEAERGICRVVQVANGSPASAAGIQVGEYLISVDDAAIPSPQVLTTVLRGHLEGETVRAKIQATDGSMRIVQVGLGRGTERAAFFGIGSEVYKGRCQVTQVAPGSPAASAGLNVGDFIVQFGPATVSSPWQITDTLRACAPGDEVLLEMERGGRRSRLAVTLAEKP